MLSYGRFYISSDTLIKIINGYREKNIYFTGPERQSFAFRIKQSVRSLTNVLNPQIFEYF